MSLRSITPKIGRLSCKKCAIFDHRTATGRSRTSNKVPFAPSHRPLQDSMVKNQNDSRIMNLRSINPVSYTHLDVYKRQNKVPFAPPHRPLQDSMAKNQNDPRNMSLRSINLKIGRLSCNKCVIFEPRTATGRFRTSNKVPFAPSHRPLQDSVVRNQNRPTDYEAAINNPKNWSIILLKMRYF